MHKLNRTVAQRPACLNLYRYPDQKWKNVNGDDTREIRESLEIIQGGARCAYCEGPIYSDGHIEHFR